MPSSDDAREQCDIATRFLFEDADVRGESVRLQHSLGAILELHQYPPGVSRLMGEFLAASVLLAGNLKFQGKLILQVRSPAQLPLLMAECSSELTVRAIARGAGQATATDFDGLLGGGHLAITVDPHRGQRYQGIVPLAGGSLAASLQLYFAQSEQLQTRLWLDCDGRHAAGMLLQQLPTDRVKDEEQRREQWERFCTLAGTVTGPELLALPADRLLLRLFHGESVRLFDPADVAFRCSCSRERTFAALVSLGVAEIEDLLEELGSITMDCEFCNSQYQFRREDLVDVLGPPDPGTLH